MARLIALLVSLWLGTAQAQILTYTENDDSGDNIALGYAVPHPMASLEAFAGFRTYDSLIGQLQALALSHPEFSGVNLGNSLAGEPIFAFQLSDRDTAGEIDTLSVDGLPLAAAVLQTGGLHPREWVSPEVVGFIAERMLARLPEDGLERYLADQLQLIWIPVVNPDGFLTTQNHPDQVRGNRSTPRDGRMRRKNLRDTDGDLASAGDTLLGVDLNRNFSPFWLQASQSSDDPSSLLYKGPAEESEPETQALLAAAAALPADSLRLFIDTHSFGRVLFYYDEGDRLGSITASLARLIGRTTSPLYAAVATPDNQRFGSTDEHFAFVRDVPAYTLEVEPGQNQGVEYGGNVVSHSGFILPDTEIARVREEMYALSRLAYYHQAGPAILEEVELHRSADDALLFRARWTPEGSTRRLTQTPLAAALTAGTEYALTLRFNKPMRFRDAAGDVANYPGQNITLAPSLHLVSGANEQVLATDADDWIAAPGLRYRDDSWRGEFTLDAGLAGRPSLQLEVNVRDLAGLALDANPATAAGWADGHWVNYEDGACQPGDSGGGDRNIVIATTPQAAACQTQPTPSPAPTPLPTASPNPTSSPAAGGSGSLPMLWLMLMLLARRR